MEHLEETYGYRQREAHFRSEIRALEGKVLRGVTLQLVGPQINLVALVFTDSTVCIQGQIGGELLELVAADLPPVESLDPTTRYLSFDGASDFIGQQVAQARAVGEAWNGHGLEVSFSERPGRTLLIQSGIAGDMPEPVTDCLRIASVQYLLTVP